MNIATPKKSGRPARLTKEKILTAAMRLLETEGSASFSIRRIAQELGTVPGNLYTYFPDKQSLLDALGEQAFSNIQFNLDDNKDWGKQIYQWMEQVHEQLLNSQDLIFLMGLAGTSPQSLLVIKNIAKVLVQAGFCEEDSVLHAQSLLWTVMSFTIFEVQASDERIVEQLLAAAKSTDYPETLNKMAIKDLSPLWKANLQRNIEVLTKLSDI